MVGRRRRPELVANHGARRLEAGASGAGRPARRASPRRPNTRANAARSAPSTAATAARGSPNQGFSLDPRPDRRHDRASRRDDPGELAEHRHRIRRRSSARAGSRPPRTRRPRTAAARSCRREAANVGSAPAPARSRAAASRASLTSMPVTAAPASGQLDGQPSRCRSPRRAPWRRRRPRRGSRGSPAAAAGRCSRRRHAADVPRRVGFEPGPAARAAEVIRDAVHDDHLTDRLGRHPHAAHGIDRLGDRRGLGAPGVVRGRVPPRHELGEDRDGDLLLAQRAEVEAGGAADAGERRVVDPPLAQDARRRTPPAACSPRARRSRRPTRAPPGACPRRRGPSPRSRRRPARPATSRLTRQPSVPARARLSARAAGLSPTTARSGRRRTARAAPRRCPRTRSRRDDDVGAVRVEIPLRPDAHEPRLAGCERAQRLADDHGLRARSSDPAGDAAVGPDDGPVAGPRRRRAADADDGREHVRLAVGREPAGHRR